MDYYVLIYNFVDNYLEKRAPYRVAHFKIVQEAQNAGYLLLGGATVNPATQGILIFKVATRSIVSDFVTRDPYVQHHLVTSWEIKEWAVVAGSML